MAAATFLLLQGYYLLLFYLYSLASKLLFQAKWWQEDDKMNKGLAEATHIANQPSVSWLPGPCPIFWKSDDFFVSLQLHAWQQQIAVNSQIESTWCFVMMIFIFYIFTCTFTYVHFSTTMLLHTESIKSRWLPFLPNLYYTILCGQPLVSSQFLKTRGCLLYRGLTVFRWLYLIWVPTFCARKVWEIGLELVWDCNFLTCKHEIQV